MEKINYNKAEFTVSVAKLTTLPPENNGEVAFLGRSNVGKSSVINALVQRRALAKVSKTPGRTQLLNFFALEDDRYLVDLPGYGFAKVNAQVKRRWQETLEGYLSERQSLRGLVLIMDIRHPLKDNDLQLIQWTQQSQLPVHILLNKADKLSRGAAMKQLQQVSKVLKGANFTIQLFSVLKKQGIEELTEQLDRWYLGQVEN